MEATEILRRLAELIAEKYGGEADPPPLDAFAVIECGPFWLLALRIVPGKVIPTHPRGILSGPMYLLGGDFAEPRESERPPPPKDIIERLHKGWRNLPDEQQRQKGHPLINALRKWHERPWPVSAYRRLAGRMPAAAGAREDRRNLPDLGTGIAPQSRQATLPGFAPDPAQPALMVAMLEKSGMLGKPRGAAPLAWRIFTEALMATSPRDRPGPGDGFRRLDPMKVSVREVAGDWLQWNMQDYKPGKPQYGGRLQRALESMAAIAIPYGKHRPWYAVTVAGGIDLRRNGFIQFRIEYPPGSQGGAQVDRKVLRVLGKMSSTAWRLYLSLCFDWDRYGTCRGRRIFPTRPKVLCNEEGYVLDMHGNLLHGRRGQGPSKNRYHPAAVRTGEREQNPEAIKRYPTYAPDDLVRMIYGTIASDPATLRQHRKRALAAIRLIEQAGGCIVETLPEGLLRIMPPDFSPPGKGGVRLSD